MKEVRQVWKVALWKKKKEKQKPPQKSMREGDIEDPVMNIEMGEGFLLGDVERMSSRAQWMDRAAE